MRILAIDTSNNTMSIAITDGNLVLGEFTSNVKKNHSVRLMPAIDRLCKECNIKPKDIEKIVVASGPGSYTGVRIGVTVAKTLAFALHIPVTAVSSLEVLAANIKEKKYIVPIFDARRGQVYTGLYRQDIKLETIKEDRIIMLDEWLEKIVELNEEVIFVGSDVSLQAETIQTKLGKKAVLAGSTLQHPRASELALLGMDRENVEIHNLVPNYIRLAEAEATWLAQNEKIQGDKNGIISKDGSN